METTSNTNNNNSIPPPAVSKLTSTGFSFRREGDASTLHVGDRTFVITGVKCMNFGEDKFHDISMDTFDQEFIDKIQAMIDGHENDFKNLTEFTITIEEAFGLSDEELQKGQKSHYFFDPRSFRETPTVTQLFTSGKVKCQLCYNKNGQEIRKQFRPLSKDHAQAMTEVSRFIKKKIASDEQDDINPNPRPENKRKPEERGAPVNEGKQEETSSNNHN